MSEAGVSGAKAFERSKDIEAVVGGVALFAATDISKAPTARDS